MHVHIFSTIFGNNNDKNEFRHACIVVKIKAWEKNYMPMLININIFCILHKIHQCRTNLMHQFCNLICCIMVSMVALCVVDGGFELGRVKPKIISTHRLLLVKLGNLVQNKHYYHFIEM